MSLKWIFGLILVGYGVNVFATEIEFNELISESQQAQFQLATQLQEQVGLAQQKTPKPVTITKTVQLEGFTLKLYN